LALHEIYREQLQLIAGNLLPKPGFRATIRRLKNPINRRHVPVENSVDRFSRKSPKKPGFALAKLLRFLVIDISPYK
jgi:hypothetical protein